MSEQADVIVVGMGPGGEDVAERLAEAGLDVVGVEAELVGGECPYWGCVPSKMMIRAADLLAEAGRVPGMAGAATVRPDWAPVARRIREEATDSWDDTVAVKRFEDKGGRLVRGWGRLEGPEPGGGGRPDHRGRPGRGDQHRHPGLDPAGGRPGRHPLLDQPGGHRDRGGARLAGGARRRGHRRGAGPGVPPLRGRGHRAGGRSATWSGPEEPEAGALLAEVFGAEGIDVRTGVAIESVHHDGHRFAVSLGAGRAGGGRAAAGGHRPPARPGPAERGLHRARPVGPVPAGRRPPAGGGGRGRVGDG